MTFRSQNQLSIAVFVFAMSSVGGRTTPGLNEKAKFCGLLCRVSRAPQIAIVMPLRRRHNDMTAVYFMYKVAAVGLPLADSYAGPVRCKSGFLWWHLVTQELKGPGWAESGSPLRLCCIIIYERNENQREPPRAPHTVLICRSPHMPLPVPGEPLSLKKADWLYITSQRNALEECHVSSLPLLDSDANDLEIARPQKFRRLIAYGTLLHRREL